MSVERSILVRLPVDQLGIRTLVGDIRSAAARVGKALPGERTDIIRYEGLSSRLEQAARRHLARAGAQYVEIDMIDAPGDSVFDRDDADRLPAGADAARAWLTAGDVAVELRDPFASGQTVHSAFAAPAPEPEDPWEAFDDRGRPLFGTAAIAARFRQQAQAAVDGEDGAALSPSGVSNRVLTEGLREFVAQAGTPAWVPVIYRDGSAGPAFPLRSVALRDEIPVGWRTHRFALLSIRHTEMDVEVDGAWFRNTDISRPRPAGQTDELAYKLSQTQLTKVCESGPALIYLYQTGLDTAILGFYRAVTEHLMSRPDSLAVVPMFFRRRREGAAVDRSVGGYEPQSTFVEGTPWTI
ncbi:hypothetical protein JOD57_000027 [Geodermatophilus bullaregiensis]|uniref:hypothetical protein n=1 Tax=Geodermatophilus bullaregiensis TaxID=1564160 RepID=UPI00195D966C|nr:hypothetical protein [Geodermatophilus bullaregiensis]MBM7804190.1 hypothetical protein [Geodermatophilus bullaregiensis]